METTIEKRQKAYEESVRILKDVTSTNDSIISIQVAKAREKLSAIEDQIKALQEEKLELLSMPITKAEVAEVAKATFAEYRKQAIDVFIRQLLKGCQSTNSPAFRDADIRMLMSVDHKAWFLYFLCVTPEQIKEAIDGLPEIGISRADREAKIKQIDKEIAKRSSLLNEELEKIKRQ